MPVYALQIIAPNTDPRTDTDTDIDTDPRTDTYTNTRRRRVQPVGGAHGEEEFAEDAAATAA